MLCDERFERLHDGLGAGQGLGAEACLDDLILAHMVDDQFIFLFDLDEQFAQLRILERLGGLLHESHCRLLNLLLRRLVRAELLFCPFFLPVRIDRFDESPAQVFE